MPIEINADILTDQFHHLPFVEPIAVEDATGLLKGDVEYGASWKKRGGVGAYMMLARKWDRLEMRVEQHSWDIFEAIQQDNRSEGIIDDVRDLRRYLNLIESEARANGLRAASTEHRDNKSESKGYHPEIAIRNLLARLINAKDEFSPSESVGEFANKLLNDWDRERGND